MEKIINEVLQWLGNRIVTKAELESDIASVIGGVDNPEVIECIISEMLRNGLISIINDRCSARPYRAIPVPPNKNLSQNK